MNDKNENYTSYFYTNVSQCYIKSLLERLRFHWFWVYLGLLSRWKKVCFWYYSRLHENFVIVPADKASNNYTFVCKRYYVDILIEELGLHLLPGNHTYNLTGFSASEVLDNHKSVLTSFGIQTTDEELDLPYIYWIPKMHKNPYKHRFIAGSSKCSTKPLSILLTKLLTHIKQGLQKYCETSYSRSGVNQMCILKNSKELLEHLQSPNFNHITSIKSFDFFRLCYSVVGRFSQYCSSSKCLDSNSIAWLKLLLWNDRYKPIVRGLIFCGFEVPQLFPIFRYVCRSTLEYTKYIFDQAIKQNTNFREGCKKVTGYPGLRAVNSLLDSHTKSPPLVKLGVILW